MAIASDPDGCPTPRAIKERLVTIRNLAKKNGSSVQFAVGASAAATNSLKRSAPGESASPLANKRHRNDHATINGNPEEAKFITGSEDYHIEQDANENPNHVSTPKARYHTVNKLENGLPTPSRSIKKSHNHRSSYSDEAEFNSDSDSFADVNTINTATNKAQSEKMKLRVVPPRSYILDEEEGPADSDVSEFDPFEKQTKEEKKARSRRGMWNTKDLAD